MKIIFTFILLLLAQSAFSQCTEKVETLDPENFIELRVNEEGDGYIVSALAYSTHEGTELSEFRLEKSSSDKKSSELQIMLHFKKQENNISSSFFFISEKEFNNIELEAVYSYPGCVTQRYTVRAKAKHNK